MFPRPRGDVNEPGRCRRRAGSRLVARRKRWGGHRCAVSRLRRLRRRLRLRRRGGGVRRRYPAVGRADERSTVGLRPHFRPAITTARVILQFRLHQGGPTGERRCPLLGATLATGIGRVVRARPARAVAGSESNTRSRCCCCPTSMSPVRMAQGTACATPGWTAIGLNDTSYVLRLIAHLLPEDFVSASSATYSAAVAHKLSGGIRR